MDNHDDDDELMDLYLLGILDDHHGNGSNNGGGCLTSFAIMILAPLISFICLFQIFV
jgi:hypothetical protein